MTDRPASTRLIQASYNCEHCGRLVTRADKPGMIHCAFSKLKFCSFECSRLAKNAMHEERFWSYVQKGADCWLWVGPKNDKGYGVHHVNGRRVGAHRYSYELHKGPLGRLFALHQCDNPQCVNPNHLEAGTQRQNMLEASQRGRFEARKAQPHPTAKLTPDQVSYIRESDETGVALAKRFQVAKSTIYAVRNGQNWSGV